LAANSAGLRMLFARFAVKGLGSNTGFLRQKIEKEPFFSLNV
jgi:hypothetical protein